MNFYISFVTVEVGPEELIYNISMYKKSKKKHSQIMGSNPKSMLLGIEGHSNTHLTYILYVYIFKCLKILPNYEV